MNSDCDTLRRESTQLSVSVKPTVITSSSHQPNNTIRTTVAGSTIETPFSLQNAIDVVCVRRAAALIAAAAAATSKRSLVADETFAARLFGLNANTRKMRLLFRRYEAARIEATRYDYILK